MTRIWGCAAAVLVMAGFASADWVAPDNPEPQKILYEAQDDTRAGRFETALAKHIWYHRNALKYSPSQAGVRLSFALGSWKDLADKFPPALEELKAEREQAKKNALADKNAVDAMMDLSAFNRVLDDNKQTVEVFSHLDREHPETAKLAYWWAEEALLKEKQYELCGKYGDSTRSYESSVQNLKHSLRFAKTRPEIELLKTSAERYFTRKSATIVALLVVNKRPDDASRIAKQAKGELDSEEHRKAIDAALAGEMPAQTP